MHVLQVWVSNVVWPESSSVRSSRLIQAVANQSSLKVSLHEVLLHD